MTGWGRRRTLQVPQEYFTAARLFVALAIAFVARMAMLLCSMAVELPAGLAALVTFALPALFLLAVPASLPLELRSMSLFEVAVHPRLGELGRLPIAMRVAACAGVLVAVAPLIWVISNLQAGGDQADDFSDLVARVGFVLVSLFVVRQAVPGIWRRSRR